MYVLDRRKSMSYNKSEQMFGGAKEKVIWEK